ncbi:ribonuclease H-like domain-containing protein [Tanacetum coccineum]
MVGPNSSDDLIGSLYLGNLLHLHNSDFNPGTIISVKLTGTENYKSSAPLSNQWERDAFAIISREESHRANSHPLVLRVSNSGNNVVNTIGNNRGPNLNLLCKNYGNTSTQNGPTLSFTNDPMMKLMSLINEMPSGNIQANMSDSGANQHMTITTKNMFGVTDISHLNLTVGHPNGTMAKIKYVGNLQLSKDVVLVVPELGYPADQVIGVLQKELQMSKDSHVSPCDICYPHLFSMLSKQDLIDQLNFFDAFDVQNFKSPDDKGRATPNDKGNSQNTQSVLFFQDPTDDGLNIPTSDVNTENTDEVQPAIATRKSNRQTKLTAKFNNYVVNSSKKYGLEKVVKYSHRNHGNYCFSTSLNKSVEASTFYEVVKDRNWIDAMNAEIKALNRNNTWSISDLPKGRKPIGSKWIFKIKYKASGEIERYEARLAAKGFSQREGIDYDETFSHVVKMTTVRCLNNIVVQNDWPLYQLNVNNVFLYGDLCEDVYMILPPRFFTNNDNVVFLHEFGLLVAKHVLSPLPANFVLNHIESDEDKALSNISNYQKLIGKLIYLTHTRPDISYSVYCLSQHMNSPLSSHFKITLKVLRYLKGSPGCGVQKSIKQATLSRSSTKAEYRCMVSATCEIIWICKILSKFGVTGVLPVEMYCDNISALQLAANPLFHEKSKHFEIDLHIIREKVYAGVVKTIRVYTTQQIADIFTKGLDFQQHQALC